jgi:hypothetical protein
MTPDTDAVRVLVCRLLAHQALPRTDALVRRLLIDAPFREAVEGALRQVGLELAENVYAHHISVRVARELETPVFEDGQGNYWSNNVGLSGGAMALLTILWSLLILPKRQHQQERQEDESHNDLEALPPSAPSSDVEIAIERKTLEADFGPLFGSQIRFHGYLSELKRRGFIHERGGAVSDPRGALRSGCARGGASGRGRRGDLLNVSIPGPGARALGLLGAGRAAIG